LVALAENNQKYFPSAFLYPLTNDQEQYSEIVQRQREGKFWEITGSTYGRYYDTSLALLGLTGSLSGESSSAKNYLVSVQGRDGCWNTRDNIIDTGFILYSGWSKSVPGSSTGGGTSLCQSIVGQSCELGSACTGAGGQILSNFQCSGVQVCCSVDVAEQSCEQKGGIVCTADQRCSENAVEPSATGSCCMTACQDLPRSDACTSSGGSCRYSCFDGEEASGDSCTDGEQLCCVASEESGGVSWVWIILLLILIILVVLAIIYRHKLAIMWHTWKGKIKSTPVVKPSGPSLRRPGFPPRPMPIRNSLPIRSPAGRPGRPTGAKDAELEDTLKKLREMSK